ncbi:Acetate kinase [Acidisarcina polymorpha]|uniref:Acetate kinase n=1 Tax=Acidisarcina polymorpha TaxID=2211140 RepID=A0A2Z5FVE8_9BACT|nr:acetate/propionate family kinase [Acidisarcina polymorpha]AXC10720.1 Acetate kinase [Acidisarcina polymorpha]
MSELGILVLNSGSSSIKFSSFRATASEKTELFDGAVDGIGTANGSFHVKGTNGEKLVESAPQVPNREAAFKLIAEALQKPPFPKPDAIGHRVVAGGPHLRDHQRITPEVLAELERSVAFAPLHNPSAIYIIHRLQELFPGVPNFVCFDSAFHQTIPEVAARFAIPQTYFEQGVRRYGAHGISCESTMYQLGLDIPNRLIIAHLGNGCSATAVKDGKSVDTSMGLTPTGGIISGTRTGDIDPGVLLYILRELKAEDGAASLSRDQAADALEKLVNRKSGMLGTSEGLSDMRDLRSAVQKGNPFASMAVGQFIYVLRKFIGAYTAVLGGLDAVVFTGGIGEHDVSTREEVCAGLESLGIVLDPARNQSPQKDPRGLASISSDASAVKVLVVPAKEDLMIASHVYTLLNA